MFRSLQKLLRRNQSSLIVDFYQVPLSDNLDARQQLSRRIGEEVQRRLLAEDGYQYKARMFRDYPGQEKSAGNRHQIRRGRCSGLNIDFRRPNDAGCVEIETFSCSRLEDESQFAGFMLAAIYTVASVIHWMTTPAGPSDVQVMPLWMVALSSLLIGYLFWGVFRLIASPIIWAFGLGSENAKLEIDSAHAAIRTSLEQLDYAEVAPDRFIPVT